MMKFLILSNMALVLFYILYKLLLQKDTFFVWRRAYLWFAIIFSVLYPAVQYLAPARAPINIIGGSANVVVEAAVVLISSVQQQEAATNHLAWWRIVYLVVVGLLLVRLVLRLYAIMRLRHRSQTMYIGKQKVQICHKKIAPFSFFASIMLHKSHIDSQHLPHILQHEKVHVKQWHSMDTMLAELLSIVFFFNPVVYLLRREIRINLEYIADSACAHQHAPSTAYQYAILNTALGQPFISITNHFNYSPLKKRIMMLNKKSSKKMAMLKYISVAPLAVLLLLLSHNMQANKLSATVPWLHQVVEAVEPATDTLATPQVYALEDLRHYNGEEVYMKTDQMPSFPGGAKALYSYLAKNVSYPTMARELAVEGRVWISFVVSKTGDIAKVMLLQSSGQIADSLNWREQTTGLVTVDYAEANANVSEADKVKHKEAIHSLSVEAIRVLTTMPKWTPGMDKGKAVHVQYQMPFKFTTAK